MDTWLVMPSIFVPALEVLVRGDSVSTLTFKLSTLPSYVRFGLALFESKACSRFKLKPKAGTITRRSPES